MGEKMKVLCSISTRGRTDTTLHMTLSAVINQTRLPDQLIIFDDNDEKVDLREIPHYRKLFEIMDIKGIQWSIIFGQCKGQHYNHQIANTMPGIDWVWRVDDDCIPEPNVLKTLLLYTANGVGAVGGSILTPGTILDSTKAISGRIVNINTEPNIQWGYIENTKPVEHLHCSFLYRAGVADYNLGLSPRAFREETLFTWQIHTMGYQVLVVPDAITWHLQQPSGGIRTNVKDYKFL